MTSIIRLDANEHPIKSVTVFKSNKAEVVRIFKLSLEEGQSKIQIRHLPNSIDTESARVSGLGDAQLFDVVCSIGPGIEVIDTASTTEVVRKLNARKAVLVKDVDTIDDVSETMVTYSKSLAGDSVGPRQAEIFFESLLSRSRTLTSTRADLEEEILQLSRQIDALSSAEKKKEGKTDGEVSMVIMAKKTTDIELRLTYLVRNATWSAAYELHATTEAGVPAPSVSLHYRARITQSTGEDWTDVKLTLSTADMDQSDKTIPFLRPTKIRPPASVFFGFQADGHGQTQGQVAYRKRGGPPAPPGFFGQAGAVPQASSGAFGQQAPVVPPNLPNNGFGAPGSLFGTSAQPPMPPPQPATVQADRWLDVDAEVDVSDDDEEPTATIGEPMSVVHESPLALTYHVEGASGVPSDGVPHQVCIAVLPFEAKILHVTVPKVRPVAYLEATVKNTSDYRLLPGVVHAFVDDSFVSKTGIVGDVAPGDVFSCTLGADPATRIRYSRTAKRADDSGAAGERSAFSEQWAATTYRSRMTVTNRHPFACELVVRDGVPVSEDEKRVSVVLRHPAGLADMGQGEEVVLRAKDGGRERDGEQTVRWSKVVDGKGGRKEGLFEWVVEVEAGKELTIETEWDVKAPVSLRWIEST
ncbi:hypothetical protein DFH94DRAFT_630541 [Russula ochroleuca]|uniref:Protein F37C4.5 n=1 Tax=Russula ochroleuca TaxID=152965 RepID=A0A9P5T9M3_9AGAM|nr:hypothetical protein DFH94DRAFT_630541 [Russula ochroleuca]